ncbi:MAG: hypothetical protein D3903_21450, partial [Candidatus Electrothrix sp. GM3_4]|nr:hypothetical protein [Candidatus Electrothrix sp. GM3_4]
MIYELEPRLLIKIRVLSAQQFPKVCQKQIERIKQVKLRKHLNADAILHGLRAGFEKITDHRNNNTTISLPDVL